MIMIENMHNITLNGLPVYDDRYIKIKIRTYGAKVYTIFFWFKYAMDGVESEFK